jgi:hypothetical protein
MKYPFGLIKDGRRKDIFSIIIFSFPIFSYFIIDFRKDVKYFANESMNVGFLFILGFHIFTKDIK